MLVPAAAAQTAKTAETKKGTPAARPLPDTKEHGMVIGFALCSQAALFTAQQANARIPSCICVIKHSLLCVCAHFIQYLTEEQVQVLLEL